MSEHDLPDSSSQETSLEVVEIVRRMHAEHARPLFAYLLGILRSRASVEDVLQQTFHKFQKELLQRQNDAKSTPLELEKELHAGWLYRVAYNEAMQLRRREQGRQKHAAGIAFFQNTLRKEERDALVSQEQRRLVGSAVEKLDAELRIIVQKRIYEEKKFRDIASELNLPLGTVLTRMNRALVKLKAVLLRHTDEEI